MFNITDLYTQHGPELKRYFRAHLPPGADAEDALHDVFVKVITSSYEERGQVRPWLYTIARCRLIDLYRSAYNRRWVALPDDLAAESPDACDREYLRAALALLTPQQAAVLRLRFVADMPVADVAQALGLSVVAVKSLQHRGVARLKRLEVKG